MTSHFSLARSGLPKSALKLAFLEHILEGSFWTKNAHNITDRSDVPSAES